MLKAIDNQIKNVDSMHSCISCITLQLACALLYDIKTELHVPSVFLLLC